MTAIHLSRAHQFQTILLLLCALMLTSLPVKALQQPPALVEVFTVEKRMMAATSDSAASVISLNNVILSSEGEGRLLWIAEVGSLVKKGDILARMDPSLIRIQLAGASAEVKRLKAELTFRENELERQQKLQQNEFASKSGLQSATATRDMVQAGLAAAQAAEAQVKRALTLTEIKAPFTGTVTQKMVSIGSYLSTGNPLLRFVDSQNLEVSLSAPIRYFPFVAGAKTMLVKDGFGQTRTLDVRAIVPVSDPASRQVEIRLSLVDHPASWIPGAPLTAIVPASQPHERVAVPRAALIINGSSISLYKVSDGQAIAVPVEPDYALGQWVALKGSPLKAGDQVIIRGGERLQPGQPITVKNQQ